MADFKSSKRDRKGTSRRDARQGRSRRIPDREDSRDDRRGSRRSSDRGRSKRFSDRGDSRDRRGSRRGTDRMSRNFERTKVICDSCGQECEVPFKPSSDKPIYCDKCFSKNNNSGKSSGKDLELINKKLDKIMKALNID